MNSRLTDQSRVRKDQAPTFAFIPMTPFNPNIYPMMRQVVRFPIL